MDVLHDFMGYLTESLSNQTFIKLTLSKPFSKSSELLNIYARTVIVRSQEKVSCVEHFKRQDITHVFELEEFKKYLVSQLPSVFKTAHLLTDSNTITLQFNRRREGQIRVGKAQPDAVKDMQHNREKEYLVSSSAPFLLKLGVSNEKGVRKNKFDKYRQINKYIEVMSSLLKKANYNSDDHLVDMGCGKGYLTFGLYDFLMGEGYTPKITGIDLKESVIEQIQQYANELAFEHLSFSCGDITDFSAPIDIIVALHACDIATDIAISKGIRSNAKLIVVAPCCHKQIRKSISKHSSFDGILQNGILLERHAELITDTIRTWILASFGYKTRVFEFISNEHTAKNLMIAAYKVGGSEKDSSTAEKWMVKVDQLKKEYGIKHHYLEQLLF